MVFATLVGGHPQGRRVHPQWVAVFPRRRQYVRSMCSKPPLVAEGKRYFIFILQQTERRPLAGVFVRVTVAFECADAACAVSHFDSGCGDRSHGRGDSRRDADADGQWHKCKAGSHQQRRRNLQLRCIAPGLVQPGRNQDRIPGEGFHESATESGAGERHRRADDARSADRDGNRERVHRSGAGYRDGK